MKNKVVITTLFLLNLFLQILDSLYISSELSIAETIAYPSLFISLNLSSIYGAKVTRKIIKYQFLASLYI